MNLLGSQETRDKVSEIKMDRNFCASRSTLTLLSAIENGVSLKHEGRLFEMVRMVYRTGAHRRPSWIKHEFARTFKWLRKEFGYSNKQKPLVNKSFEFTWEDEVNIKGKNKSSIKSKLEEKYLLERKQMLKKLNV